MDFNDSASSLSPEFSILNVELSTESGTDIFTEGGTSFGWRNILFAIIGTVGVIGNLLTTIIIFSSDNMRCKVTNKLIINQSILDLCGSIMMIASAHIHYDIGGLSGISGELYCRVWMTKSLLFALFCSSTYNLVIITIEKYISIVYPLSFRWMITGSKLPRIIIFIWLFGIIVQSIFIIPPTVVIQGYCLMSYHFPSEFVKKVVEFSLLIIFILLPLGVMIFCYSHMFITIKRLSKSFGDGNQSSTQHVRERRMTMAKVNIFKTMVMVCLCYFLCWILNLTALSLLAFDVISPVTYFKSSVFDIAVNLVFLNCCINPFIYTLKYSDFQIAAMTLFCKNGHRQDVIVSLTSLSTIASNVG